MKTSKKLTLMATFVTVCMTSGCAYLPLGEVAEGVQFESQSMANLNEEELTKKVNAIYAEAPKSVTIVSPEGIEESFSLSDLGIAANPAKTVETIMAYGYKDNLMDAFKERWVLYQNPVSVTKDYEVNEALLKAFFKNYALEHNIPLAEGSLAVENGVVVYVPPQKEEKVIDGETMAKTIMDGLVHNKLGTVPVSFTAADTHQEKPESLQSINTVLASYTSTFNMGARNRVHNIALATEKVNGTIIKPGEVFSYNHIVGERTAAAGYAEAPVIINGKLEPGIGGGICQLSSTLFGATLRTGLQIVERTNHFSPISYMPLGQDATVSYGSIDYKFKNTYGHPIYIDAHLYGNELTVHILGHENDLVKAVAIENTKIEEIPFKVLDDKGKEIPQKDKDKVEIPEGYKVKTEGTKGLNVTTKVTIVGAEGRTYVNSYTSYYNTVDAVLEKDPEYAKKMEEKKKLEAKKMAKEKAKEKAKEGHKKDKAKTKHDDKRGEKKSS